MTKEPKLFYTISYDSFDEKWRVEDVDCPNVIKKFIENKLNGKHHSIFHNRGVDINAY